MPQSTNIPVKQDAFGKALLDHLEGGESEMWTIMDY